MRDLVIKRTRQEKLIAIVHGIEKNKILPLSKALCDGGIHMLISFYPAAGGVKIRYYRD